VRLTFHSIWRSRPVSVLLVSLPLILLISSCNGASPETRARQTRTARLGSPTPTLRVQGTVVRIDHEQDVILTAEAFLPIAGPLPPNGSIIVVGTVTATVRPALTEPELTEEMITAAMAKADARVCVGPARCYAFPDRLEDARETGTPKGRCPVGWIIRAGGRESWNVWLEVAMGLIKLIAKANA
jgi:hypothetical protein